MLGGTIRASCNHMWQLGESKCRDKQIWVWWWCFELLVFGLNEVSAWSAVHYVTEYNSGKTTSPRNLHQFLLFNRLLFARQHHRYSMPFVLLPNIVVTNRNVGCLVCVVTLPHWIVGGWKVCASSPGCVRACMRAGERACVCVCMCSIVCVSWRFGIRKD